MTTSTERYFETTAQLLDRLVRTQSAAIEQAAVLCADALCRNGFLFTFGTGHSHLLAEEIFYRAGGLARICPILRDELMLHQSASESSQIERQPNLAAQLLEQTALIAHGGVMLIFSNSGCNTVAVELAQLSRERGLPTVCITNLTHAARMTSRHGEGLKLCDVCDVVIDNCGCYGDAAIDIGEVRCGPTSTVIGAAVLEAMVCRTVELCQERGCPPEVFASANTIGGDERNAAILQKYKPLIPCL